MDKSILIKCNKENRELAIKFNEIKDLNDIIKHINDYITVIKDINDKLKEYNLFIGFKNIKEFNEDIMPYIQSCITIYSCFDYNDITFEVNQEDSEEIIKQIESVIPNTNIKEYKII